MFNRVYHTRRREDGKKKKESKRKGKERKERKENGQWSVPERRSWT